MRCRARLDAADGREAAAADRRWYRGAVSEVADGDPLIVAGTGGRSVRLLTAIRWSSLVPGGGQWGCWRRSADRRGYGERSV